MLPNQLYESAPSEPAPTGEPTVVPLDYRGRPDPSPRGDRQPAMPNFWLPLATALGSIALAVVTTAISMSGWSPLDRFPGVIFLAISTPATLVGTASALRRIDAEGCLGTLFGMVLFIVNGVLLLACLAGTANLVRDFLR